MVGCHQSMPNRRTPIDRGRRVQITPAMVALWKRGQEILATKAEQKWEEEGGRRREFLDLAVELHELLDRRPWEFDVFYVDAIKPSDDQDQGELGRRGGRAACVSSSAAATKWIIVPGHEFAVIAAPQGLLTI